MMTTNVGSIDRGVRIVAGIAALSLLYFLDPPGRWWGLVGIPLIGTGLVGWCPAYLPFGIDTR
jgi:hypothetical protein